MGTTISNLKPGQTYVVQFAGVLPDGTVTPWTNSYSITAPSASPHPPVTSGAVTYPTGAGNMLVSWSHPTKRDDFDSYVVEVLLADNTTSIGRYNVPGSQNTFNFTYAMNDALNATPKADLRFKVFVQTVNNEVETTGYSFPATTYPAVAGVQNPVGVAVSSGVNWKWNTPTTNADIVAYYEIDVDAGVSTDFTASGGEFEATVYGLNYLYIGTPSTAYAARVRAVDIFDRRVICAADGTQTSGALGSSADATAPSAPSVLGTTSSSSSADGEATITLTWTAGADAESGIAGHFVRWKRTADTAWTTVFVDGSQNSLLLRGLPAGAVGFDWAVMAQNKVGLTSAYVASTFTTAAYATVPAVSTVSAAYSGSDLVVTWADGASRSQFFSGYEIELTRNNQSSVSTTKTYFVTNGLTFTLSPSEFRAVWGYGSNALPSFATGAIKVYARDTNGQRSAAVSTTGSTTLSAPSAPVLSALTLSPGTIQASWSAITGAVSYDVVAAENAVPTASNVVATVPGSATKATFAMRVANSANVIQVRAVAFDVFGQSSGVSAASQSTPVPGAPGQPTLVAAIDTMKGTWTAGTNAGSYEVAAESLVATPTTVVATTDGLSASWQTTGQSTWYARVRGVSHVGTVGSWSTAGNANSVTVLGADTTPPSNLVTAEIGFTKTPTPLNTFRIDLDWSAYVPSEPVDRYVVEWATSSLGAAIGSITTSGMTAAITGLPRGSGLTYYVRVRPYDKSGNNTAVSSLTSANERAITAVTAPAQPATALTTDWSTDATLRVSWTAPAVVGGTTLATDVIGYRVYFTSGGTKSFFTKDTKFDFTPEINKGTGLSAGDYVRTFAIGAIVVETISDGDVPNGTVANTGAVTRNYNPTMTTTMNALSVGARAMTASWTPPAGAVRYAVYIGTSANPTAISQTVTGAATSFQTSGTSTYYVRIKPYDEIGTLSSGYSNEVSATAVDVVASDIGPPGNVGTLTPTVVGSYDAASGTYTYDVSWANVTDTGGGFIQNYELSYKLSTQTNWTTQVVEPGAGPTVSRITGLWPSSTYNVSVKAVDNAGNRSATAATVNITTSAGPAPNAVVTRSAAWVNNNQDVDVTFTALTQPIDFDHYEVRFNTSASNPGPLPKQTIPVMLPYNDTSSRVVRITSKMLQDSGLTLTGTPTISVYIVAVNLSGVATVATVTSTAARPTLAAPSSVAFSQSVDTVNGSWTAAAGASRYRVYYGPTGNRTQFVSETTATSWRLTFVDNFGYYYSVAAVDGLTGVESSRIVAGSTVANGSNETQVNTAIDAKSGKVGGWNVNADSLYHPTDSVGMTVSAAHTDPNYGNRTVRFWAGGTPGAPASGKMKIYSDGSMWSTQGRVGGWEMLADDIISTGSSIQSVHLPGTVTEYIQSDATHTPGSRIDVIARFSLKNVAPGGTAVDRVIVGAIDSATGLPADIWSVGVDQAGSFWIKVGTTVIRSSAPPAGLLADDEEMWIRFVYNRGGSTYNGNNQEALNVANGNAGFFYGGSAGQRQIGAALPTWTRIGSDVASAQAFVGTNSKVRIGGVPGTSMAPFIGKISDVYIKSGVSLVSSFRASDISKATNQATNTTAGTNPWTVYGTQVGVTGAATGALNSNSLFETGTAGWTNSANCTIARDTSQKVFGTGSLRLVTDASGTNKGAFSDPIEVSGGKRYAYSGYGYGSVITLRLVPAIRLVPIKRTSVGTTKTLEFANDHGLTNHTGITLVVKNSHYTWNPAGAGGAGSSDLVGVGFDNADVLSGWSLNTIAHPKKLSFTGTASSTETDAAIDAGALPEVYVIMGPTSDQLVAQTPSTLVDISGGATSWTTTRNSSSLVMPSAATHAFLTVAVGAASATRYVDGIRLQSGSYTDAFGYSYSATDSIRLESTGSVNIVNDYGRVDITNRKQSDVTDTTLLDAATFLAPTVRFIGTGRDGSASLEMPAEITNRAEVFDGNVANVNNSLFLHSGSLYALGSSTDQALIDRKRRVASLELVSNTNASAGSGSNDPDPTTEVRLSADTVRLTGSVEASAKSSAGHLYARDRLTVGETEFGALRNIGAYSTYSEFAQVALNLTDVRSSDFVVIDGIMYTPREADANIVIGGKFMHAAPSTYGWTYTDWDSEGIDGAFGTLTAPQGSTVQSPKFSLAGSPEEIYVQAAMRMVVADATETQTFKVEFFNSSDVSQGVTYVDDSVLLTTNWENRGAFVTVPSTSATVQLTFKTGVASNSISVGRVFVSNSFRETVSTGFSIASGTNLVTGPAGSFSLLDLGRRIKVAANASTLITGVVSDTQVYVADNATVDVTGGLGACIFYDPDFDQKFLRSWVRGGQIEGPPGPATNWTVSAESIDATLPPEAVVGGDSPNNTLHLKIPAGPATFAQINTAAPVARAEGDMWFDISRAPTVPSLLVSSKEFTDGIQVYNTTQTAIVAKIGSDGKASFTANGGLATLNSTYWATYSTTYDDARYYKDAAGIVHLSGLVKSLSAIDADNAAQAIFTLPAGFRPVKRLLAIVQAGLTGGQGFARLDILPTGEVMINSGVGFSNAAPAVATYYDPTDAITVGWVTLTGISFQGLQ